MILLKIKKQIRMLGVHTYAMTYSPQCDSAMKSDPDIVCPNDEFFDTLFKEETYYVAGEQSSIDTLAESAIATMCPGLNPPTKGKC